jgi:hypothetical protein
METLPGCKIRDCWEPNQKFQVDRAIAREAGGLTVDAR